MAIIVQGVKAIGKTAFLRDPFFLFGVLDHNILDILSQPHAESCQNCRPFTLLGMGVAASLTAFPLPFSDL